MGRGDDPAATSAAAADALANSAHRIASSTSQQEDSADRRTELAADRTVLAAERTYAAWVRTGLAALAAGIGARSLLDRIVPDWLGMTTGVVLVAFAGFCFVAAIWRQMLRIAPPRPDAPRLPEFLLVVVNGFLLLVCLAAIVGILL